ncbi:Lsr2 family protein [Actinoallomurus purpureus]|uniref:histone-like nucleoid-structuring protein Lsr2 n=1 Tax=Actinoallomurus purpureus TaxID=478114 RepID=UPI002093532F|nr:Lsr2 family protein [Actinoallomurus purpureus]MCO6009192.1 Lsr2 family protein [Actinoallomurus purpureus]
MAEQMIKRLIDDLDGEEAAATVPFSIDGTDYVIDLSAENAGLLRERLAPFIEHARRAGGVRRAQARSTGGRLRSAEIRAWARTQGIKVNERGRIPATVVEEYERSH